MNVVDPGVVVELVVGDLQPVRLGDEELIAPHLIDSEGQTFCADSSSGVH